MRAQAKWALVSFRILALVAILSWTNCNRGPRSEGSNSKEPPLAPDFTLPQLDGQPLRLSSYRGKVVLLDFWATWCVPCREEIPHFVELQEKYRTSGLQIIGVSLDDGPEPVRTFYQQFHLNYPVVMGTAKTGELYGGVLGLPIAFVLDEEGRIRAKHIGATSPATIEKEITQFLKNH